MPNTISSKEYNTEYGKRTGLTVQKDRIKKGGEERDFDRDSRLHEHGNLVDLTTEVFRRNRPGPRHRRPGRHWRHSQLGDQPSSCPRGDRCRVRVRRRAQNVYRPDGRERTSEQDEAFQGAGDRERPGLGTHQRGRADKRGKAPRGLRRRRRGALKRTRRLVGGGRVCASQQPVGADPVSRDI